MTRIDEPIILKDVPGHLSDAEILNYLYMKEITWKHVNAIRDLTAFKDDAVSDWLNISVRTLRDYCKPRSTFKDNFKEQVLLILALIKHGKTVFGSKEAFDTWLMTENFYFDNKKPETFMNTVTGLRFIDDRLTAIQYGDNV